MSGEASPEPAGAHNRKVWDEQADDYQQRHAGQLAASGGMAWGVWQIPESDLRVLGEVEGLDVLEIGCGAAQWSIALHRRGARVTALDNSARQLEHARELMAAAGVDFPLVHAEAERTGLADESFDVVFCDHGALPHSDPQLTVPEAARLLRPGGLLAFCMHSPIVDMCWPHGAAHPGDRLAFGYWSEDLRRFEEPGEPVTHQLPYGEWIALFGRCDMVVEDLIELRPDPEATSTYRDETDREWARRWPMENVWRVRKAGA